MGKLFYSSLIYSICFSIHVETWIRNPDISFQLFLKLHLFLLFCSIKAISVLFQGFFMALYSVVRKAGQNPSKMISKVKISTKYLEAQQYLGYFVSQRRIKVLVLVIETYAQPLHDTHPQYPLCILYCKCPMRTKLKQKS